jgi:peptidoglycan/xylan/chitin deacetylase (PgdA/CDA1 family)
MLLTFLYHRIGLEGKYSNSQRTIEANLSLLANKFKVVVPGDKLSFFKLNVCLTFDDGYFDFYHFVFPLLKKLNIKAVLAVPVKYIQNRTNLLPEDRLTVTHHEATLGNIYKERVPFCTWEELDEMAGSGLVEIACHSFSHKNLLEDSLCLEKEIIESKKILEKNLNRDIHTFIYPLGKFNKDIHQMVKQHYSYVMRIGSAINLSWQNWNNITYRIVSDNLKSADELLKPHRYLSFFGNYLLNTLRGR